MAITTAQYKAAIEAKIAAATGSTALEDLALIKNNADLWLQYNPTGTITGYSSLEGLIQTKQNALTGSSTLDDITLAGVSAFQIHFLAKRARLQFTTSQSWTVPDGVFWAEIWVTGGGSAGGGSPGVNTGGGCGGSASPTSIVRVPVRPGDVLQIVIGAGGTGGNGSGGTGGISYVYRNGWLVAASSSDPTPGGLTNAGGNTASTSPMGEFAYCGGFGRSGGATSAGQSGGNAAPVYAMGGTLPQLFLAGVPAAAGGTSSGGQGGGGGGGSSIYGIGGAGGNGSTTAPTVGGAPATTSYGAGGGGAGGNNTGLARAGGNGANGIVEIYF